MAGCGGGMNEGVEVVGWKGGCSVDGMDGGMQSWMRWSSGIMRWRCGWVGGTDGGSRGG